MKIGNRFFDTKNHTYIMGILNVTPDSFSDGGKWILSLMMLTGRLELFTVLLIFTPRFWKR